MSSRVRVQFPQPNAAAIKALPPHKRGPGMLVVDQETGKVWQLNADSEAAAGDGVLVPDVGPGRWLPPDTAADDSVTARVSTEESTRTSAVTSIDSRVSTETSTRGSADTSLTTRVSSAESTEASSTASINARISSLISSIDAA